jgi:hypothetical protein
MRISKLQFFLVLIMILILPLSSSWKLICFGEKTTGRVVGYSPNFGPNYPSNGGSKQSIIRISTTSGFVDIYGPDDILYPINKKITLFYNPENPKKNLLLNFVGLFLSQKMIVPGVLLLLWVAFYLTVTQSNQKPQAKSKMGRYWQSIDNL